MGSEHESVVSGLVISSFCLYYNSVAVCFFFLFRCLLYNQSRRRESSSAAAEKGLETERIRKAGFSEAGDKNFLDSRLVMHRQLSMLGVFKCRK